MLIDGCCLINTLYCQLAFTDQTESNKIAKTAQSL